MLSAYLLVIIMFNGPNANPTVTTVVMPPDEKACIVAMWAVRDSSPLGMKGQCVPVYDSRENAR